MNKRLYVGNLSYSTTEDELHKLFSEVGPVASVSLVTDRATGQSKGFAFVEMETAEAAETAVQRLNGHEVDQRNLTVSEARPRRERTYGEGGGRRRY
ncbi:MAG: RNA-binding protein [Anaerolineae bacterium CG2_30_64_16]|nr:MAG: RNA-binding protein [Anaerolineae bacterium CG2_30_64_16]